MRQNTIYEYSPLQLSTLATPLATSEQLFPARTGCDINKQNGGETCKFINSDFRAFCLKKYTIGRENVLLKLKFNYSSKLWLFWTCKCLVYAIKLSIYYHDIVKYNYRKCCWFFFPCYLTKHLMCTPSGNSEFCFPSSLNVSLDFVSETLRLSGKQNSLIPSGAHIMCIMYNDEVRHKLK